MPTPRSGASMAWDPAHRVVLLFGGDAATGPSNDLDAWDGTTWRRLASDGPAPRDSAVLVADPVRGVVVLQGGRSGTRLFTDTWEWDGTSWLEKDVPGPSTRVHAVGAFDHDSRRVLLHGGAAASADGGALRDTWAWDGTAWTRLDQAGPSGVIASGMAWDVTAGHVLLLEVRPFAASSGAYQSELWVWAGGAWQGFDFDGPTFSPMQSFVEGPRHPLLIDGGALQGMFTAHAWDGDDWQQLSGSVPPPRNGQAAAFDAERHQLVLFGSFLGERTFGDTWLLEDGGWRRIR